jgi:DNA-binding response OmpR family regulator
MLKTSMNPLSATLSPAVLVVDESADIRNMLCEAISAAGCIAVSAQNGDEALEFMKTVVPHAVLLDAAFPPSGGFELGRRIRSMSPSGLIPILFMLEQANPDLIVSSYENGGIDYILKPLCVSKVLARLFTYVTPHFCDNR